MLPPDSEIVAAVSIRSPLGIQLERCSLIESKLAITENYGVLVGRTLASECIISQPRIRWRGVAFVVGRMVYDTRKSPIIQFI